MDVVILFRGEFRNDYFLLYTLPYFIQLMWIMLQSEKHTFFNLNFLKKCYLALNNSKQVDYSDTEICIWSNAIEKEH